MKRILITAFSLLSFSAWAEMPVLSTDITPNQKIISFGYGNASLSQELENGYDSVVIDTDASVKSLELILSGSSSNQVIPVASLSVAKLSSDDSSEDINSYDIYAGLALEGDMKKNLLLLNYSASSEDSIQNAYGVMAVFRSEPNQYEKSEYELVTSLDLKDATDNLSGGHSAGISMNSKYPFSSSVNFISSAGMSLETDTEYASGEYRKAGPEISAELGLSIQPQPNIEIEAGLATYLQHFQYYQSNGDYAVKETRSIIGFTLGLNIAI